MIILLHVLIAISSIVYSSIALLLPSERKLKISYALIAATLASGFYLVFRLPAHLVSACESGLAYLAFTLSASVVTHWRLATQNKSSQD